MTEQERGLRVQGGMMGASQPDHLTSPKYDRWGALKDAFQSRSFLGGLSLAVLGLVALLFVPKIKDTTAEALNVVAETKDSLVAQINGWFVPSFRADLLHIHGTRHSDGEELRAFLLERLAGSPEIIPIAQMQQHALAYSWVVDARVIRLHNGEMHIEVTEHTPVAIYGGSDGSLWLVNSDGMLFTEIAPDRLKDFSTLLRLTGFLTPEYVTQILSVKQQLPQAFENLVRADRLQFASWKLWYRREAGGAGYYYVYVDGSDDAGFAQSLQDFLRLDARYQLNLRDVQGYDLRALPHLRIEFFPTPKGDEA